MQCRAAPRTASECTCETTSVSEPSTPMRATRTSRWRSFTCASRNATGISTGSRRRARPTVSKSVSGLANAQPSAHFAHGLGRSSNAKKSSAPICSFGSAASDCRSSDSVSFTDSASDIARSWSPFACAVANNRSFTATLSVRSLYVTSSAMGSSLAFAQLQHRLAEGAADF